MNIARIEIIHIEIPLKKTFETSFGTIAHRPAIIVRMTSETGLVGFGEASPLSVPISEPETVHTGIEFLRTHAPGLIGTAVHAGLDITQHYPHDSHPVTRIGLESAYLDLLARSLGMPLSRLFGATRSHVAFGESASLRDSYEQVEEEVREYIAAGATRIKVKIAPGRDIGLIEHLAAAFPTQRFAVDANAAFGPADIPLLAKLSAFDVPFVEQPFSADDLDSHARLRSHGVPICLDESIASLDDCRRAIALQACDMVNIKPARVGSFSEAKRIHDACVSAGIALFGGGRLETGVGKTTNAAFYALPGFTEASDITPPTAYLETDIITPPFTIERGIYEVPREDGLGVAVDDVALAAYERERFVFEA